MVQVDVVERLGRFESTVDTVQCGGEHDSERQVRVGRGIGETQLGADRLVASLRIAWDADEGRAVLLRPADVDGCFITRYQALVRVHTRGDHGGQGAGMGELPGNERVGRLRKMGGIVLVEEYIFTGVFVEQALVAVHAGAVDAEDRLGHEGGDQTMLGRDRLDGVLESQHIIRGLERIRKTEVDLVLAQGHFMMANFHFETHGIQSVHQRCANDNGFVER